MCAWWSKEGEEDEEEDSNDVNDEDEYRTPNDRLIFLIDARSSMFELINKNTISTIETAASRAETHFKNCLKVALSVMKSKVIASDKSAIGITFFGTRERNKSQNKSDVADGPEGVYTLFPMSPITAQRIRHLQSMIDDMNEFHRHIGSQPPSKQCCPLKQALWSCSQSFATKDFKKTDYNRVWIFTNDDNPNGHNPAEQNAIVTVSRDCSQAGIEISLWHLNQSHHSFNPLTFYSKLLIDPQTADDGDDDTEGMINNRMLGGGYDGFDALITSIRLKEFRKRRLGRTLLSLGEEFDDQKAIGIQIYKTLGITKRPYHTWLYSQTNEPVKTVSKFLDTSTGATLTDQEIQTFLELGGAKVPITKKAMDECKYVHNRPGIGIQILYFLPIHELPNELNLQEPYFVFPDESAVKGSSLLFELLLKMMSEKKLVGLIRFNRSTTTVARLAILYPQPEALDPEDDSQLTPPGMFIIPLPFAEEIRYDPIQTTSDGKEESESAKLNPLMNQLIHNSQLKEDFVYYRDCENPSIQNYYSILQAIALNQEEPEWQADRDDKLVPDAKGMKEVEELGIINEIKSVVSWSDAMMTSTSTKKTSSSTSSRKRKDENADEVVAPESKKKPKAEEEDDEETKTTPDEIKELIKANKLSKLTVAQLKKICSDLSLRGVGLKAELIARIEDAMK